MMKRLLVVAALLLTGCGGNAGIVTQALVPDTKPDSASVSGSVDHWVIDGHGNVDSERFHVTGGDYAITWWASCDSMPNVFLFMDDVSGQYEGPFDGTGGSSRANGLEPADLYFSASAGPCDWKATIDKV